MEKLTLERLHAIAQIVVPPPRFFRFVDREKGMPAPDWQSCLEMATYCGLDISDFYRDGKFGGCTFALNSLEGTIEVMNLLDRAMAQLGKDSTYLKDFTQQLKWCREQRRLILRLDNEGGSIFAPTYFYYVHGAMIAKSVYERVGGANKWALFARLNSSRCFSFDDHYDRLEFVECRIKHLFKGDFQN